MVSPELISKALSALKRQTDYEYFFSRLHSRDWIVPLRDAGLFNNPPQPIQDGDTISYPHWPESQYLVRMAGVAPETVMETILQVSETENARVLDDFVHAAIHMPPGIAARIVPKAVQWVKFSYFLLPERMGELISHLAQGGFTNESLLLARELLAVFPDERIPEEV